MQTMRVIAGDSAWQRSDTGSPLLTAAATVLVFLVALVSRVSMLGLPPIYDEVYQLLPALSFQAQGDFAVLDGIYDRAHHFSQLVAFSLDLAGQQSMAAARFLPSVLPGALLVAVVFVWARIELGWIAALCVAGLLVFWPNGVGVSQYLRFYALQGLFFVSGALLVHTALIRARTSVWRGTCLIGAAVFFVLALHLHRLTLLGMAGIALWALLVPGWIWVQTRPDRNRILLGVAIACVGVLAVALLGFGDQLQKHWTIYRWAPWPAHEDPTYYHRDFRDNYPTLWTLFPLAALVALRVNLLTASFCVLIFATTFVLQSFGGLKGIRYLYPTTPFFFLTWAIVAQAWLGPAWRWLVDGVQKIWPGARSHRLRGVVATGLVGLCCLWGLAANPALPRSAKMIIGAETQTLLNKRRWAWHEAQEISAPWLRKGAVLVSTEEMLAVAWLGDYDLGYNRPRFSELDFFGNAAPFTIDRRSGRPLIGMREDLLRVVACEPVGIVMANAPWIRGGDAQAIAAAARDMGAAVTLEAGRNMSLLGWEHPDGFAAGDDCADLADLAAAAPQILSGARTPALPATIRGAP
ncbi:MAG: hypothetical protein OIF47_08675 [Marinibacterium sp.]|nr:hypothetical protein [Marinibacterium sp.]